MNRRRLARTALLVLAGIVAASSADACCLTDCLYGRQPAYAIAPTTSPIVAAYPPLAGGYVAAPSYTAGYTPLLSPTLANNSTVLPLASPGITVANGPIALQRPAYGAVPLDNPSVYTGLPVASGYRGLATTGNPFYGTGNIYPNNYASANPSPVTAFRPDLAAQTTVPITGYIAPEPQFATPVRSGLSRFFNSLLGTGYRSSYYPAQVTYYRPATTIDPVLGSTVTVQQPCTSTVQQLQRAPYTTFDPLASTYAPAPVSPTQFAPTNDCRINPNGSYGYGSAPSTSSVSTIPSYDPNGAAFGSGVQQTGDLQPVAPPTLPSTSYSLPMTMTPLTNATPLTTTSPPSNVPQAYQQYAPESSGDAVPSSSDRLPLEAPSLNTARPSMQLESRIDPYNAPSSEQSGGSASENSNGSYYERSKFEIERDRLDLESLTTQADDYRKQITPIPAPSDFRNPFENSSLPASAQTVSIPESPSERLARPAIEAPDLLPRLPQPNRPSTSWEPTSDRQPGTRLSVPVREASILGEPDRVSPTTERPWQGVEDKRETSRPETPTAKTVWYSLKK